MLLALVLALQFQKRSSKFIESNIEQLCGDLPTNFVEIEIPNNYIFENDPEFPTVQLWDIEGNTVYVNSYLECSHYFLGGWKFFPKATSRPKENILECSNLIPLKIIDSQNSRTYFKDIEINILFKNNNFKCIGKIKSINTEGSLTIYEVFYSRTVYIFLSQILILFSIIFIKFKKVNKNYLIFFLLIFQILIQLYFNFNTLINVFNNISIYSMLLIVLYLNNRNKNEVN